MNQAVRSVKRYMFENVTSKRSKSVAELLGVTEVGDLANICCASGGVPLLVAEKDKTPCLFHGDGLASHRSFLGACLKMRMADHRMKGSGNVEINFIEDAAKSGCQVKGASLPQYNEIFVGALDAYLHGLGPEGHLLQADDKHQVKKSMASKTLM